MTPDQLLEELRRLVKECEDEEVDGFYHDSGRSADFAATFAELDEKLSKGDYAVPREWR